MTEIGAENPETDPFIRTMNAKDRITAHLWNNRIILDIRVITYIHKLDIPFVLMGKSSQKDLISFPCLYLSLHS